MPDEVRFHLDEHINDAIAAALRTAGIDVTTTVDVLMCGDGDDTQLIFSRSEGRVLVTDDSDFFELARQMPDHAGIVFCLKNNRSIGDIVRHLILIHGSFSSNEMRGLIDYVL